MSAVWIVEWHERPPYGGREMDAFFTRDEARRAFSNMKRDLHMDEVLLMYRAYRDRQPEATATGTMPLPEDSEPAS